MKKIAIIAIVLSIVAIIGEAFIFASQKDPADEKHQENIRREYRVYAPLLPDTLTFAGERVPLELYYVYEALDRELSSMMYQQLNTQLIIKRSSRYLPEIDSILRANNMPMDMRYLSMAESSLTNAVSPSKAKGFWQFMDAAAKQYNIEINEDVDMRFNLEIETQAACDFMKYLYNKFGNWTMAAAAYNRGHNGLARQQEEQQLGSYYDMYLNTETSRYIYRILAYKIIMQNPQNYGFCIRKCDQYPVIPYKEIVISGRNVSLIDFAREHGCPYKVFRMMNPWLMTDILRNSNGNRYIVRIPTEYTRNKIIGKKDTSLVERI